MDKQYGEYKNNIDYSRAVVFRFKSLDYVRLLSVLHTCTPAQGIEEHLHSFSLSTSSCPAPCSRGREGGVRRIHTKPMKPGERGSTESAASYCSLADDTGSLNPCSDNWRGITAAITQQ